MTSNKKAQMEIIGLVVIVILITLGVLFLAIFALKEEPTKKVFTRKGLASSAMSSILKTTASPSAGCVDEFIGLEDQPPLGERILEDCVLYYYTYEGDPPRRAGISQYSCDNLHSCAFFNDTVWKLLNDTLGKWGKKYVFKSEVVDGLGDVTKVVEVRRGNCPGTRDSSGPFPISVAGSLVESRLYVCD